MVEVVVDVVVLVVVVGGGSAATTPLGADVRRFVPAGLAATMLTTMVWFASAAVSAYVSAVAPTMSAHPEPNESQRPHCTDDVIGAGPSRAGAE